MAFKKWFDTFLEEKNLPLANWHLTAPNGIVHQISSEVVIEAIAGAPAVEQAGIKNMIVRIDFANGDVNDYFRHLGQALVNSF